MFRLYKKNLLNFSLVCIFAYVVIFSAADSFSETLGIEKILTAPVGLLFVGTLFGFIKKHDLMEECGLCAFRENIKKYLYFLPLLLIVSTNLWNGVTRNVSVLETALFIVSMLCVGFLEEVIFRGFLFKAISRDSLKIAILVSSLTFGLGHIVNLLNGADLIPTLLQICYASAIGFLFAVIFYRGKSLLPCILAHSVFNSLSIFGVKGSRTWEIITSFFLCVVSVGYGLWIWRQGPDTEGNSE